MKLNIRTDANTKEYNGIIVPMDAKKLEGTILATQMARLVESGKLKAEGGSTFKVTRGGENITEVTFMVIDEKYYGSYRKLLSIFGDAYRSLRSSKADHIAIDFIQGTVAADEKTVKAAVEAVLMAEYSFDDFKTKEENKEEATVDVLVERDAFGEVKREAEVLAAMNLKARELVNLPANHINPTTLAERAVKLGQEHGFETQVLGFDEIKALGMEAFLSVARASDEEPKLIVMRYTGNLDSDERLGLVGKGLTYDSGGLSIKSTAGMVDMKGDMAGAAAVIGAISAVASMKLRVNVTSVVAACENMISGRSYRPGDIIGSMGKKSIFIGNTDAEGRLTLIDAMQYIVTKENVTRVLDIATLTGAALKCGGTAASVSISNNDEFFQKAEKAFLLSGEQLIRMPVFDEYRELIKHEHADLTNIAGDPGTITAGLFVGSSNGDKPWIHVDIAGTFMAEKTKGIYSKGATGEGVRPLYYLAKLLGE